MDFLRTAVHAVKAVHPFDIVAIVILPEHLHAIWTLPEGDADYPMRWSLIKAGFSRQLPKTEGIRASRVSKRERGIWQPGRMGMVFLCPRGSKSAVFLGA